MFALGVAKLCVLSALAMLAGLSVALRARFDGRAETAAAAGLLGNALVLAPIYALGLTHRLTPASLGVGSLLLSSLVLAASWIGLPKREAARALGRETLALAWLPLRALGEAWAARSVVLIGVAFSAVLIVWTAVTSYYAPSWRQWDALWYHEPIVAFTIQNHGFSVVDLPQTGLQKINGYPRLCEMTQLWFVIFTDRRLIEIANSVLAPLFMLVVYLLAQRQARLRDFTPGRRVASMGWAAALLIMPVTSILLASAYVDIETALFVLAAAHFCTRAPLRLRDAWMTALCLAMAIGAKILALAPVGVLSLILLGRVVWAHARSRPRAMLATIGGGVALMLAMVAATYWRNWVHFHNPFWPDLPYENPRLGIHWPGMKGAIEDPLPFRQLLDHMSSVPYSRSLGHANQVYEYGFVAAWFLFPVAAACLVALWLVAARAALGWALGRADWRLSDGSIAALYLSITLVGSLLLAPVPFWGSRYFIAHVGLAMVLVCWAGCRPGFERLREGTVAVAIVGAIVSFFWVTPRWWYWPSELVTLAQIPYPAREVTPAASISPDLGLASGSPIPLEVGLAREALATPGSVLAFDDYDGIFAALFWNNAYSNRVVYVPSGPSYLARVDDAKAVLLYCSYADPMFATVNSKSSGWEAIGPLNMEKWGVLFRRAGAPKP